MYDLTHPVETGMPVYPGDPDVSVTPAATHAADGCRVSRVELGSHAGTHVDAPAHTEPDGRTLDGYSVAAFVLDAAVVDCRDLGAREAVPADRVPDRTAVDCAVFRTGWDRHWGDDRYRDHPYLAPATARACADRGFAVATDTLSPDPTPTADADDDAETDTDNHDEGGDEPDGLPAHHAVLGAGLLVVENLTGLGAVGDRFELRVHPLALGGDGAPARAVGVPR